MPELAPGSVITSARSYPRNVEVRHVLTYDASEPPSNASTGTISVEMNQSMIALPDDPMTPRPCDNRVGYFNVERVNFGLDAQRAEELGADVLVVGSGGREHALVWALAQSARTGNLYAAPGNAGTAQLATNLDIPVDDLAHLSWRQEFL